MKWVLQDYPELVPLFRGADHWVDEDGHVTTSYHVEDLAAIRPALRAWAAATGADLEELPMGSPAMPVPSGEPLTMRDAAARVDEIIASEGS